jgi:hypothetical protein
MLVSPAALPILHAAHPIWYRGNLVAVASQGEVFSVDWLSGPDRTVVRALGLAVVEAPYLTPDQQLDFAAYFLLPEERWGDLQALTDDCIASQAALPVDLVRRRRTLPTLGLNLAEVPDVPPVAICA